MSVRRFLAAAVRAASIVMLSAFPALAHEGDSHGGEEPKPVIAVSTPTLEAVSADFQLVATAQGPMLRIYLDRFATNEPVKDATIEVSAAGETAAATPVPDEDGVYRLQAPWLSQPGTHELTFLITAPDAADLLIGSLTLPVPTDSAPPTGAFNRVRQNFGSVSVAVIAFLLGSLTTAVLSRRRQTRAVVGAGLIGLGLLLTGGGAFAHGGEDHSHDDAKKPAAIIGGSENPRRLPDGSLYAPKPTQRLLSVRTIVARIQEAAQTIQLTGQIAADPNGGGHVQATQTGRVEPGDKGLPYIGQFVEAGQVLAYIAPAVTMVDRGGVQQQIAGLEQDIVITESRLERLKKLAGSVPQRDIDEAEANLAGLRKRRAALSPSLTMREPLRAPISGMVTANNIKAGQVVESRDQVLFEILDPSRLMVEAQAFDPKAVENIREATAVTANGTILTLEYLGRNAALKQQAIPLLFRISTPPSGLGIGQPVRIIAQIAGKVSGIVLPKSSVTRSANGQTIVWLRDSPQRFVARPVRIQPVDGDTVLAPAGVAPGDVVVTDGAGLLNQIR